MITLNNNEKMNDSIRDTSSENDDVEVIGVSPSTKSSTITSRNAKMIQPAKKTKRRIHDSDDDEDFEYIINNNKKTSGHVLKKEDPEQKKHLTSKIRSSKSPPSKKNRLFHVGKTSFNSNNEHINKLEDDDDPIRYEQKKKMVPNNGACTFASKSLLTETTSKPNHQNLQSSYRKTVFRKLPLQQNELNNIDIKILVMILLAFC